TPNTFYRIDLSTPPGTQNGQFVNATSAGAIAYGGAALQYPGAVPTQALYYNTIQSTTPGSNYAPLVVRVLDSVGRPVMGVPVTFTSSNSTLLVQGANQVTDGKGF